MTTTHVPVSAVVRLDAHIFHLDHQAARPPERVVGVVFEVGTGHLFEKVGREMRLDHLAIGGKWRREWMRKRKYMLFATGRRGQRIAPGLVGCFPKLFDG